MTRRSTAIVLAFLLLWSSPALAWDAFRDDRRSDPVAPARAPDPAPFVAPPGVYYVTDTYVADVVTSRGPLTTYSTTTTPESTGSYARMLETVATGVSSVFDGRAFNGRRSLGDGRLIAGTYYENYVLTEGGFVPVSIVFFQDDSELAGRLSGDATGPFAVVHPLATAFPGVGQLGPTCCTAGRPVATSAPTSAPTNPIWPGISLLPLSGSLTTVEVLRGRAVTLWPRAFMEGRELPVRSWTVVAGSVGEALATSGPGNVPFRGSWLRLAPPGAAYEVVFRIEVDSPDTSHRTVDGSIAVIVRSPALEN